MIAPRVAILVALVALAGCRTAPPSHLASIPPVSIDDKPEQLRTGYRVLNQEGARNYVLNQMEIGMDAMQLGHYELAATSFDEALDAIETVYGEDRAAQQARQLWHSEGRKTFKGEPYERAMTYYFRGLLYIRQGDLENARACFRAGIEQDAFVEKEQHRADFASLLFLEAWCSARLGDRSGAEEAKRWLDELRPDAPDPTMGNLLLIGETGKGPIKKAEGRAGERLAYYRGEGFRAKQVEARLEGGQWQQLYPCEDIFFQASTRGGRPVDYLLANKVVYKENLNTTGTALTQLGLGGLIIGSSTRGGSRDTWMAVSGAAAVLGLISSGLSDKVNPRADTRRFRNLPDHVHLLSLACPPGEHTVEFRFLDDAGRPVETQRRTLNVGSPTDAALAWARQPEWIVAGRYVE